MRARTHTHTCTFPFYTWFDPTKRANRHKTEVHDKEAKYKKIKSKLAFFSESVDHVWMVYFIFAMCLCVCMWEFTFHFVGDFLFASFIFPLLPVFATTSCMYYVARTNDSLTQLSYRSNIDEYEYTNKQVYILWLRMAITFSFCLILILIGAHRVSNLLDLYKYSLLVCLLLLLLFFLSLV